MNQGKYIDARRTLQKAHLNKSHSLNFAPLEQELEDITRLPISLKPNDFTPIEKIGTGNFSDVFKTEYTPLGSIWAVKMINKDGVENLKRRHPNVHNEISMEKRSLIKLNTHPHITTLLATMNDFGSLYFVFELHRGGEVWDLMTRDSDKLVGLPLCQGVLILWQLIDAISYMHSNGIIHRDLKPENLMISKDGLLKVIDFGTAKDVIETNLNGPEFVGTGDFMSPECVNSNPSCSFEMDLWSLGCIAYQVLSNYFSYKS